MASKKTAVVVTTKHRGVFYGYLKNDKKLPAEITLTGARNCIYWDSSIGGFMGLVSIGPNKSCRIGERVPEITLYEITSVSPATDEAAKAWDEASTYGR